MGREPGVVISATFTARRNRCIHCGQAIMSIDGWIHEGTGLAQCIWQPPPLVATPGGGGNA